MSESELRDLSSKVQKQQQNVSDVTRAGQTAVSQAGSEWQSSAFETFKARWQQDKGVFDRLAADLSDWTRKLNEHSTVAARVNRPFR
ncbi:MAG: WXG100 family type VII secretion target [Chloroflexi bacterium]|nr:WXG100 family type VII secretion target [Chloroflexota bacterium]